MSDFMARIQKLPVLGIGVSTEYGASSQGGALYPIQLHRQYPHYASYMEFGIEAAKGLDKDMRTWSGAGLPSTYHFLDVNLNEDEDLDEAWLAQVCAIRDTINPAWMCGDLGVWHLGRRERGHMLLLPPILTLDSVKDYAKGIQKLREATKLEVLPENPPGPLFLGDMGLLEFFGLLCETADTGMLLDCAHLVMYQRAKGRGALEGLAEFPLDRIIEIHIAGGTLKEHDGFEYVEDSHTPDVLDDTWLIAEHVIQHAPNLKAITYECERNSIESVLAGYRRIESMSPWRDREQV